MFRAKNVNFSPECRFFSVPNSDATLQSRHAIGDFGELSPAWHDAIRRCADRSS